MAQPLTHAELTPIFYQLPPERIVVLKSLLESYESVAELRTLDAGAGVVVVLALTSTEFLVRQIITAASSEDTLGLSLLREIAAPENFAGDWLLQEMYSEIKQ